ncbi:MAG: thioredoxin [Candidatus Roizmanbacteria bacterium]|nr:thioredoxin [Candidatus Roizmanbacteria bacterium]
MAVLDTTQTTFKQDVLDKKGLIFVDFFAEWCGPCKMTGPIVDQLSESHKDMVFYKVNVDENGDLASQFSVFSIPTFVIFKDGQIVGQFSGGMGKEGFEEEIRKVQG